MFVNEQLKSHLLQSATIKSQARVTAEWNLNYVDNISAVGNYRHRPLEGVASKYGAVPSFYDPDDEGYFYTDATYSDTVLDGGIDENQSPILLKTRKEKENLFYSLEDCFGRFRPRSGINKVRYGITPYVHHSNPDMALRPRYYMSDKTDNFKYWTSYRVENGIEYGIGNASSVGRNHINDAAPFVVYKTPVTANRLVFKMQTNVGTVNQAPLFSLSGPITDPFYGFENQTTPSEWRVDVLDSNNQWKTVRSFTPASRRPNGEPIIGPDGYAELAYGLIVPEVYSQIFRYSGELGALEALPVEAGFGDAYLVKSSDTDLGIFHIWTFGGYERFVPVYGWRLVEEGFESNQTLVSKLSNPDFYVNGATGETVYREFEYIKGIRIVVSRMNKFNSVFDLIEMSPRLLADITDNTTSFSISKIASDLGTTGLPVGQLLASVGSLELFDPEQAFSENNENSIIPNSSFKNMKINFYDEIYDGDEYYAVPIKTMYADDFPEINSTERVISFELRDLYLYFESLNAPQLFLTNVSTSYAISVLLDYIGFTNYEFKRVEGEVDDIIPFFYVDSDQTIAEVLQSIAISTQSAMFFDEYNNFIVMSKNYLLPSETERETDLVLYGTEDFAKNGIIENENTNPELANIIDISSQEDTIFNDGKILFTNRYIQKSQASTKQAYMLDSQKTWVYKPVLLWEATGEEQTKTQNEQEATQNSYALTAIPLNSNLSEALPEVINGEIVNNIIDFGEGVYWLGRYNGYFYANGEIIRYDAIEYSVPGIVDRVWITSTQDYQDYFSKITFRGKMYPTGRVRIFSEPNYKTIDGNTILQPGAVAKHGRGQFGTTVTSHFAGISPSWTDGSKLRGLGMNSKFLFGTLGELEPIAVEQLSEEDAARRSSILSKKTRIKQLYEEINFYNLNLLSNPGNSSTISQINSLQSQINALNQEVSQEMSDLYSSLNNSVKYLNLNSSNAQAQRSQTTGKIKNFLSYSYATENQESATLSTQSQMVQASALVMDGAGPTDPTFPSINHISYVYNSVPVNEGSINKKFSHFGTRMRVLGKIGTSDKEQEAFGSMAYLTIEPDNPEDRPNISGGSGGIAGLLNPLTGEGYYFEIAALDAENVEEFNFGNVFFYKVISSGANGSALPQLLWRGVNSIIVDSGDFVGQSRVFAQENQTVYDISFEYADNVDGTRTFYLYLNGSQIGTVTDTTPIVAGNSTALFVRGTSKCMFENIYALSHNYGQTPGLKLSPVVDSAFGTDSLTINDSFTKYAISGLVQSTYLSGISSGADPQYNIYYDEFGTIMREAAYLNIRYDKAYPSLYSKIASSVTKLRNYVTSSYYGGAYGAEFLLFNTTDTVIALDGSTESALRIQGITFTQNSENELTVDEYFNKNSDLSNPIIQDGNLVNSALTFKERYQEIKNTRITYGKKEFSIQSPYIQNRDTAISMMAWLSTKIMRPRKAIGANIFSMPILQLGDVVEIDYTINNISEASSPGQRFVVYQIDYSRDISGPTMQVFLSEV